MHSALKRDGKPLYEYARAGIELEREPRRVTIHSIRVVEGGADRWTLDVSCSKGTYIRTLAADIGAALGCGAYLAALRRTGSGALSLDQALTLDQLAALDPEALDEALPAGRRAASRRGRASSSTAEDAGRFLSGVRRRLSLRDAPAVRVYGPEPGAFLGTGHVAGGELIATRLLSPLEVEALVARRSLQTEPESVPA